MQKNEIFIVDLPSPGQLSGVFSDLILALTHTLTLLGFKVRYEQYLIRTTSPVIIFGLYRLFINNTPEIKLPNNYFNFNLAPIFENSPIWFNNYLKSITAFKQIDYSYSNISYLKKFFNCSSSSYIFKFGYFNLSPFKGFERKANFLFYGKLNDYRSQRLQNFTNSGLILDVQQNTWGIHRDIQIKSAKAVINIAKYNQNILEVYRIWHSLCLGTPVYSDTGCDLILSNEYSKFIHLHERLEYVNLLEDPIPVNLYKSNTNFTDSVSSLLEFIYNNN